MSAQHEHAPGAQGCYLGALQARPLLPGSPQSPTPSCSTPWVHPPGPSAPLPARWLYRHYPTTCCSAQRNNCLYPSFPTRDTVQVPSMSCHCPSLEGPHSFVYITHYASFKFSSIRTSGNLPGPLSWGRCLFWGTGQLHLLQPVTLSHGRACDPLPLSTPEGGPATREMFAEWLDEQFHEEGHFVPISQGRKLRFREVICPLPLKDQRSLTQEPRSHSLGILRPYFRASLVAQRIQILLPMQGTWTQSLVQEDSHMRGATQTMGHNYWACSPEPAGHSHWSPRA